MFLNVINPANGTEIDKVEADTREEVEKKYKKARIALSELQKLSFPDRVKIINRFQNGLRQKKEQLSYTLSSETGKPITQSRTEIQGLIERINFFVESVGNEIEPNLIRQIDTMQEYVTYEPLGVIANISAWNYPYFVGGNVFIPAILTGNCVLYKPSEFALLTGKEIVILFLESGLLEDVFQGVYGDGATGGLLTDLPVDGVFFTGSNKTGQKILEKLSGKMIPVQLELGGKDPAYVHYDIDIEFAVESLASGAFYNNGQSCCAVERIYVHQDIYDEFLTKFIQVVEAYEIGDPLNENTFLGPITRSEQIQILESQIEDAKSKGARIVLGGKRLDRIGYFFEPTILIDVNHKMDVMREESFGPLIGIQCVKDEEEAVRLMQDTPYGLTSAVYSKDKKTAEDILGTMNTGSVYWNTCDRVSPYLPWSGLKSSGVGVTLGLEGIRSFIKPKAWHLHQI